MSLITKCLLAFSILFIIGLFFAPASNANRPIPGYPYPDVCNNIDGVQTVFDVTGISARYKYDTSTENPNDCIPRTRLK